MISSFFQEYYEPLRAFQLLTNYSHIPTSLQWQTKVEELKLFLIPDKIIAQVATGYSHNIILTGSSSLPFTPPLPNITLSDDGEVYTWGREAQFGQMGYENEIVPIDEPRIVPNLAKGISRVYAGPYSSFIVYHADSRQ